jgi:hypothetical protein
MVMSTTATAPMSLYEVTSTDGVTWSAPIALGSGGTKIGADFPAVAAGPTAGDFRVAWMDDRNGAGAFNVCGIAPLLGVPFSGSRVRTRA